MRHLVTGGAGFIGSHLVDRLLGQGHEVVVIDNLSSGRKEFVAAHGNTRRFRLVEGDVLDAKTLREAMKGCDTAHHLAANPDIQRGTAERELDLQQTVVGTVRVLEAARDAGVKRFAFSSSSTVYGETDVMPTPEHLGPLKPISLYGAAKLGAEAYVAAYADLFGMQAWIFRFANIIGPRATHGVIYDFIEKLKKDAKTLTILGDGRQKKSYLHVEECVEAWLHCMAHANEKVNIVNLGTTDQLSVDDIGRIVIEECGLKGVELAHTGGRRGWEGDIPVMLLDISRLAAAGWKPKRGSRDAVRDSTRAIVKERWKK